MTSRARSAIAVAVLLLLGVGTGVVLTDVLHLHPLSLLGGVHREADQDAERHAGSETESESEPEVVASVRVAPVVRGRVVQSIDVYGSVVPRPGALIVVSPRSEVVIRKMSVKAGQLVSKGDALAEVEPSPATAAQLALARADVQYTAQLLQAARDRQAANLATRQEVLQAEAAQREAELKLQQAEALLPDPSGIVRANSGGRVSAVHVEAGAVVPAGTAIVDLLADDALAAQLSARPVDAVRFKVGQAITVESIGGGSPVQGTITFINSAVDSTSHMVNLLVEGPADAQWRVGEMVRGRIETVADNVLAVPRSAVLPDEDGGHNVFVIDGGRVHRKSVRVGLQNPQTVEIVEGDLKPGEQVITQGNYEVLDGMPVQVENTP